MMDASDQQLFERSVRQAIEGHTGDQLDRALDELGWRDALGDDALVAVSILFPLLGEANASSQALGQVVLAGSGLDPTDGVVVVLPALGGWSPPGARGTRASVSIRGVATADLRHAEWAVVATAHTGATPTLAMVPTAVLHLRDITGIDPAARLLEVSAEATEAEPCPDATGSWMRAVVLAQLALSYEILGASRAMLELARDHALTRVQYGQPISRFQAVRHRLAETLVAIETADAVVTSARSTPTPELAAAAKALAGRGARTAARHCQQVLAGVGFTAEHPFHRHFRRILLLDQLFGSAHALTTECGDALLGSRQLPALLPL